MHPIARHANPSPGHETPWNSLARQWYHWHTIVVIAGGYINPSQQRRHHYDRWIDVGGAAMPYDPNRHHRRSIRLRGYDYTRPGAYFITICTHGRAALFGGIDGGAMGLNDAGRMVERWWGELNHKFPTIVTDAFVVMPNHIHGIVVIGAGDDAIADSAAGGFGDAIADSAAGGFGDAIADSAAGGYMNPPRRHDTADSNAGINAPNAAAADSNAGINAPNAIASVGADVPIRPRRTANESNDADDTRPRRTPDESNAADDSRAPDANPSLSTIVQWFKIMTTTEYIRHVKQSAWPAFDRRVWQRGYYERIIRDERQLEATRRYIAENPARSAEGRDDIDTLLARMQAKE